MFGHSINVLNQNKPENQKKGLIFIFQDIFISKSDKPKKKQFRYINIDFTVNINLSMKKTTDL